METASSSSVWGKRQTEQEGGRSHPRSFQSYSKKAMGLKEDKMPAPGSTSRTWMPASQTCRSPQWGWRRLTSVTHSRPFVNRTPTQGSSTHLPPTPRFHTPIHDLFIQPKDPAGAKKNVHSVNTNTDYFYTTMFFKHFQDQQESSQNVTKWILALTPVTSESMTQS